MKKNFLNIIFTFILFLLFSLDVYAECTYQERTEMMSLANRMHVSISINDSNNTKSVNFILSNLSDKYYIKYYNTSDNNVSYINQDDLNNGIFIFDDYDLNDFYSYKFEIYSANNNCYGNKIITRTFKKPALNKYSKLSICREKGMENYQYCKEYINDPLTFDEKEFLRRANLYLEKLNEKPIEVKKDKINVKLVLYIVGGSLIGIGIIAGIVLFIRKRNEL